MDFQRQKFLIVKTGSTFSSLRNSLGDFEDWTIHKLGFSKDQIDIFEAPKTNTFPQTEAYLGIIILGSHDYVTDRLEWSERLADWLRKVIEEGRVPMIGICYGHQLLAHALGGKVETRPSGRQLGTVKVHLGKSDIDNVSSERAALSPEDTPHHEQSTDYLFSHINGSFLAHTAHLQSVVGIPEEAKVIAYTSCDRYHAVRFRENVWGLQFHPEFTEEAMKGYIMELADLEPANAPACQDLLENVSDTKESTKVLQNFVEFCVKHCKNQLWASSAAGDEEPSI